MSKSPREAALEVIIRERVRREIPQRTQRMSSERLPYVLPLLNFERQNKPFVAACGVKVILSAQKFIFTAAHVIDALNAKDLWFVGKDGAWSNITGESRRTNPPPGKSRNDDRVDAAVIRLSEPSASNIPGPFLGARGMDVNEVQDPATKYLILGYPASRTKKDFERRKVTPRSLQYVGNGANMIRYREAGLQPYMHVAIDFDREQVVSEDGILTAPRPDGMSGCGVWRFDSLMKPGAHARDRLVAILIEHPPTRANLLIATRVSIHMGIVRSNWPELASELPPLRRVKINLTNG